MNKMNTLYNNTNNNNNNNNNNGNNNNQSDSPSPQPLLIQSPLTPSSHQSSSNLINCNNGLLQNNHQQQQQQQQYCLKWNNHRNNMIKVFNELLNDENFVDVTLACDGLSIKAHKLVLSACSTYFRDLFINNPCKHPIVILKDINYEDLQAIIHFMYSGEVNVSYTQLGPLLKTAETLKIKGLTDVNEKHGNTFFNGINNNSNNHHNINNNNNNNNGSLHGQQYNINDNPGSPYSLSNGTTTTANDTMTNFYNRMALESLTNQALSAAAATGGGNIGDINNITTMMNGGNELQSSNAYLEFMAQRFKKRRRKHKNGSAMALANVFNNANGVTAAAAAFNSLAAAAAAAAAVSSNNNLNSSSATTTTTTTTKTTNGYGSIKRSSNNNAKMFMFNRQQSNNNNNNSINHLEHNSGKHNGNGTGNGDHHHQNDNDDLGIDSGDESISNLSLQSSSKHLKESSSNIDSNSFSNNNNNNNNNNNSNDNGHNNQNNHHQRSSSTPPQSMINGNTQQQDDDDDDDDDNGVVRNNDDDDDVDDGGGGNGARSNINGDTSSNIGDNENGDSMVQDSMMMSMNDSDDEFYPDVKPIVSLDESPSPTNSATTMDDNNSSSFNNNATTTTTTTTTTNAAAAASFAAAVGPILENSLTGPNSTPNSNSTKVCVCHLCHLTFTAYSSLRRHMTRHFADRERYECDICRKSYSRKDYLKEHKKLKHSDVAKVISSQRGQKHHQQQQQHNTANSVL